jgi:hypothetical protein
MIAARVAAGLEHAKKSSGHLHIFGFDVKFPHKRDWELSDANRAREGQQQSGILESITRPKRNFQAGSHPRCLQTVTARARAMKEEYADSNDGIRSQGGTQQEVRPDSDGRTAEDLFQAR